MAGSNLATPLYAVYERRFGFSSAVLTVVFATYALVLAPSLLVFGQLSDRLGRRRVISAGLATATVGLALFALAAGLGWLFAARAVQGLAVGMISGAAAAALVELDPSAGRAAATSGGAVRRAGPGGRERGRGRSWRGCWPSGRRRPGCCAFALVGARDGGLRGRRAGDPRARDADRRRLAHPAPGRAAGHPRAVRAHRHHRRRRLGGDGAVSLRRAVVRRDAAGHVEPRAAGRDQRAAAGRVLRRAAGRADRRAGPAPRPPGSSCSPRAWPRSWRRSRCTRCPSCWPPRCSPAPGTASPSWAPRRSSTAPPRPTAAARSTRPSTPASTSAWPCSVIGTGLLTLRTSLSTAVTASPPPSARSPSPPPPGT